MSQGSIPTDPQQHKISSDQNGNVKTVVKFALYSSYTLPALGAVDPENSNYFLTATEVERQGKHARITLTYSTLTDAAESEGIPETTYVESSSTLEKSIRSHPDFSSFSTGWDEELQAFTSGSKVGTESYLVGTTQVTKTSYHSSLPSSERDSIGTRESPGAGYGSSDNWLLIGANRSKPGYYYVMEKTYLYNREGWDEDIYE